MKQSLDKAELLAMRSKINSPTRDEERRRESKVDQGVWREEQVVCDQREERVLAARQSSLPLAEEGEMRWVEEMERRRTSLPLAKKSNRVRIKKARAN